MGVQNSAEGVQLSFRGRAPPAGSGYEEGYSFETQETYVKTYNFYLNYTLRCDPVTIPFMVIDRQFIA